MSRLADRHGVVHESTLRKQLTVLPLVFVMFFNISGGAFTTESLVAETGPGLALLILLLVPIVWAVPETLIIGELASMLPEEGGYYRWVHRAFGPFWAFQNGWVTWMYSLVDMAIYPALFNSYLAWFVPGLGGPARWAISLAVIWGATAINLRGALPVGRASTIAGLFVLGGFAATALAALPHLGHSPFVPFVKPGHDVVGGLGVGLSIALWNYIGWDNASTVQGEVVDATRAYPRALAIALPLITLGYLIPLVATLAATDWTTWREGGWPDIARLAAPGLLGTVLAGWLAVAALVSALSLFNALLLSYSRIPLAMATDGLLPRAIADTDARGTPRNAVILSAVAYSLVALIPFAQLVVADVVLYAMALFLEFGALVRLRRTEPELRGAFRVPVGRRGIIALAACPMVVMALILALSVRDGEFGLPAVIGSAVAIALGPLFFLLGKREQEAQGVA